MIIPKHKKGAEFTSNWLFWISFIIILGGTVVAIASMILYSINDRTMIPQGLEESTLISRIYGSGECFAYKDKAGKVHAGTIDFGKFTQEQMDKCFPESGVKYAFHATLEVSDLEASAKSVKTRNWAESQQFNEDVEDVLTLKDSKLYRAKLRVKIKDA